MWMRWGGRIGEGGHLRRRRSGGLRSLELVRGEFPLDDDAGEFRGVHSSDESAVISGGSFALPRGGIARDGN